ncbi:MAG: CBS domain-containing protein [Chloroflexi bacterium]|nr:CBS domain-containing protein [Chloroflexota bacterium]
MKDLMDGKSTVVIISLGDTIRNLKRRLRRNKQRAAIVINTQGIVEGVITVKDLEFAKNDDFVDAYYKSPPYTIAPNEPAGKAVGLMNKHGNHQLIVVDDRDRPLGIIWDWQAILDCERDDERNS